MLPGDIAVLMDEHVGIGDDLSSYALHPGDSGLVINISGNEFNGNVALLISGHIIYVCSESVQRVEP